MNRLRNLAVLLTFVAAPAAAEVFRYVAFGDSVTAGIAIPPDGGTCTSPPPTIDFKGDLSGLTGPECGYAPRLEGLLGCTATTCTVDNEGFSSDRTTGGLSRIDRVLDTVEWDVVLLMLGTLDIWEESVPSLNTMEFNLKEIAKKAALRGTDTLHASIIWLHPDGSRGTSMDSTVEDLRNRIEAMAVANNRYFADQWDELCGPSGDRHGHKQGYCFGGPGSDGRLENNPSSDHYVDTPPDPVGHPDADGYQMMAQRFFETIRQSPRPAAPIAVGPSGATCDATPKVTWTPKSPATATWYQLQVQTSGGATAHDDLYPERDVLAGNGALAVAGVCPGTTCSVTVPSLAPGSYRWRVRGRNPGGHGAWSAFTDLTIPAAAPAPPTALSPTAALETFDSTPSYSWGAVAGADRYELQIDGGLPKQYDAASICSPSICSVEPPSPVLAPGAHSWRLRARNCLGWGSYGPANSFTVLDCAALQPTLQLNHAPTDPPVTNTRLERACQEIRAANTGDYRIESPGDVTFLAGEVIRLYEGFTVGRDADFTARVDPP